jgi:hypothetical protein
MCGKTSIAKELSFQTDIPYFKAVSEHETYLEEQNEFLMQLKYADPRTLDFLAQTGHSVIFDRAYPSERVYSELLNRRTDNYALVELDLGYGDLDARLIICVRSTYEGIVDDIDPKLNTAKLKEIDRLYRAFAKWTCLKTLILDTTSENLAEQISVVREFLGY